jgi:ribosomal protein S19E (S16A)
MPNRIKSPHNVMKGSKLKEDQRHRINVNRTDLLHFYVRFTNILRRIYSQEFNIGLKHFQLYYQTSSSMDSANLKIVFQRCIERSTAHRVVCRMPQLTGNQEDVAPFKKTELFMSV